VPRPPQLDLEVAMVCWDAASTIAAPVPQKPALRIVHRLDCVSASNSDDQKLGFRSDPTNSPLSFSSWCCCIQEIFDQVRLPETALETLEIGEEMGIMKHLRKGIFDPFLE